MIFLASQKDINVENPSPSDLYSMGTVGVVMRMLKLPDGRVRILAQGLIRARIESYEEDGPYIAAKVEVVHEPEKAEKTLDEQKAKELEKKVRTATFNLEDFLRLQGKSLEVEWCDHDSSTDAKNMSVLINP
jgi:ATP-dependent Lon protease